MRRKRRGSGTLTASVGGLQANASWIRWSEMNDSVPSGLTRQKPRCSTSCRVSVMARCVPYASGLGRLTSSKKRISRF